MQILCGERSYLVTAVRIRPGLSNATFKRSPALFCMGIRENCGISLANSPHDAYKMMKAMQHRGRDAAGMAVMNQGGINVLKWGGLVTDLDLDTVIHELGTQGIFAGHVRYSTKGGKDHAMPKAKHLSARLYTRSGDGMRS